MFNVNSKDTRTKSAEVVAVSFGVNQTQKQLPEVFYKKSSQKFRNIYRKTTVLKSLLNKSFQLYKKGTPTQVFYCEYCEIFKNTYYEKHLPTATSVDCKTLYRATESLIEMKYK